jgi:hypothetical protein
MGLWELLVFVYDTVWVRIVLVLLGLNIVTGVAAALFTHTFYLGELGRWLMTRALPFVLVAGAFQLAVLATASAGEDPTFSQYAQWFELARVAVWLFVIASFIGHILDDLKVMGIDVPRPLTSQPKPPTQAAP